MKKILIATVVIFSSLNISAQSLKSRTIDLKLIQSHTVSPRLRNTGIVFLCFGLATIAGGAALVSGADGVTSYSSTNYNGVTTTEGSFPGAMGALGIVGGSISTIGGGLMTYFGQRKLNKSKGKNLSFNFTPVSGSICYHF